MTAPQWEPSAEAVEAFQRDMLSACGMTPQGTIVRAVLRRQHAREKGLLEAMRSAVCLMSTLSWPNGIEALNRALAAHAKLDAPKVPTPTGCPCCGAATMFVRGRHPGDDNREVCPTCLLEKVEDMAANATRPVAYKAAVEREERK